MRPAKILSHFPSTHLVSNNLNIPCHCGQGNISFKIMDAMIQDRFEPGSIWAGIFKRVDGRLRSRRLALGHLESFGFFDLDLSRDTKSAESKTMQAGEMESPLAESCMNPCSAGFRLRGCLLNGVDCCPQNR